MKNNLSLKKGSVYILFLVLTIASFGQSKTEELTNVDVQNIKAIFLGKTKKVSELVKFETTDLSKKAAAKKNRAVPPNFIGRGKSKVVLPALEHQGPDPLRQLGFPKNRVETTDPIFNFEGLSNGGSPHDPSGDIGVKYYVQAINATRIGVYDKTDGSLVSQFTGNSLWSPLGESSAGDPIIIFDHEFNRWIITEFTSPNGSASILFAISETDDPLGSYHVYVFTPPSFPDYPKYGIWKDTYMVTTNELGPGSLHQYFFDRSALLNGEEDVSFQRVTIGGNSNTEAGFYVSAPVHWLGDTDPVDNKPMAVKINDSSWGEVAEDAIEIFTFDVNFTEGTTVTKTTLETTPFDSYPCDAESGGFACLSQGGSVNGVDGIPEVVMNMPQYRNFKTHESIVLSFITDVTDGENLSGIRWMELRRTAGADWSIFQEGTFAPDDGLHRFMSSTSIDIGGNIALAYNVSGPDEFIGIRYTGRYSGDELGIMTLPEVNVVSGTNSIGGDRFGDYAQMSIDPSDERTFWYTTEYATGGGSSTRIVSFQLENNDNDLEVSSILNPTSGSLSSNEVVTVKVTNRGSLSAANFDLVLKLNGSEVESYTHAETVNEGEVLEHTFSTALDLSDFGQNEIEVLVVYASDEIDVNNSTSVLVETLALLNGEIELNEIPELCGSEATVFATITNKGSNTLESLDIDVLVNDGFIETVAWTGSLATNKEEKVAITIASLLDGENSVSVSIKNPNNGTDQITANDESTAQINNSLEKDQVTLMINSDDFPEETTWQIVDDVDNVIFEGGPYSKKSSTILESFCIASDACYTFTMFDSFGDGICCGDGGNGSYTLTGAGNELIFESSGTYTNAEATNFCTGSVCNLVVIANKSDADGSTGGTIILNTYGSYGYQFSVDGGVTFQEENIFENLASGTYEVVVKAQNGECIDAQTIEIERVLGVGDDLIEGLKIGPNPTDGIFKIFLEGHNYIDGFLKVQVLDLNGRRIQENRFNRYNDVFEGTISLYAYPKGIYFIKLMNSNSNRLIKVIRK